jgi:NAD(P)-dependent dehydrogenase (short-subunit alcohol dehydrogenase family)
MAAFSIADLPDLSGKTVIVTGASSGIGRTTAIAFAHAGARVALAVRDPAKGRATAAVIAAVPATEVPVTVGGAPEVRELDLARLDSIHAFAAAWQGEIDLLINNAGVMVPPLSRTADGFELQFGTNHLGHFALTNLLLPSITGRVVTVSSGAHLVGRINFADLNWEHRRYHPWRAYGQSKLANLLFTAELQRRLTQAGSPVRATAAHPGYAATNLGFHSGSRLLGFALYMGNRYVAQDAASGALPTLYAAVADIPGDSFAGPGFPGLRGAPKLVARSAAARDADVARRLWSASEELTNVSFPDIQKQ